MTLLLFLAALVSAQVHALGVAWTHAALPDPFVLLAAFIGLFAPWRVLPWAATGLGWGRALVSLAPAGAEILAAAAALAVVASQREAFDRERPSTFFFVALLAAGTHAAAGWLLALLSSVDLSGGMALLTGTLLALPLARVSRGLARGVGWLS